MIPGPEKAEGNDDIVAILKQGLAFAEEGRLVSACLVACEKNGTIFRAATGLPGTEHFMRYGLETVSDHYKELIQQREQRPAQRIDTADYVCWSLRDLPHSYDFLCALVGAEMRRIREGAPAPLKFCFYGQPARSTEYAAQFYNGVMVPALAMVGAVIDPRALSGRALGGHDFKSIVEASRRGETVPKLKPSPGALVSQAPYANVVTLTLREAEHCPERNTNIPEWLKFADYLKSEGHRVVFVRDTAKAHEPIEGYEMHPLASLNLDTRLALYESAKCNVFGSNGPFGLALFGSRPWLSLQYFSEDALYESNRPSWWAKHYGMEPGMQYPWSRPDQQIVWGTDDFETLKAAWLHYASTPMAA